MARRLRFQPEEWAVTFVTVRCTQGRMLLRLSPRVNDLIIGVLAAFMGYVNGNIAREIGRIHRWRDRFWGKRYTAGVCVDEQAQRDVGVWVDRPALDRARGGSDKAATERRFESRLELKLHRFPCWEHLDDVADLPSPSRGAGVDHRPGAPPSRLRRRPSWVAARTSFGSSGWTSSHTTRVGGLAKSERVCLMLIPVSHFRFLRSARVSQGEPSRPGLSPRSK